MIIDQQYNQNNILKYNTHLLILYMLCKYMNIKHIRYIICYSIVIIYKKKMLNNSIILPIINWAIILIVKIYIYIIVHG